ncbi:TspO/MBR family protein [Novosphingobium sp. NPDC080210]|uniref:TspO/MBR family protein n=1 Tax=Novosphingobium sp. NPDC080210 TaxID=3390596 RepID=UPI003CFFE2B2
MTELASPGQLRASLLRWSLFLAPLLLLLGTLSGMMSGSGGNNYWFAGLEKPAIYPPPATFGIVWTILYLLMGIALAMVVTARGAPGRGLAIAIFVVQFLLNLAWSPVFFGMQLLVPGFYLLLAIDVAVLLTVVLFYRVRPLAAWLLVPYLAWVLFAAVLNWQFVQANPEEAAGAQVALAS